MTGLRSLGLLACALLLVLSGSDHARSQSATVVASCPAVRAAPYTVGTQALPTVDPNGNFCVNNSAAGSAPPSSSPSVGITPVVGGSAVSSLVLKAGAGNLYSVYANCTAACWLMVFNSITAPSNGATTAGVASGNMVECIPIASGGAGSISYAPGPPAVYSVGITATISSTACATLRQRVPRRLAQREWQSGTALFIYICTTTNT